MRAKLTRGSRATTAKRHLRFGAQQACLLGGRKPSDSYHLGFNACARPEGERRCSRWLSALWTLRAFALGFKPSLGP
jgi:hypothetical protein